MAKYFKILAVSYWLLAIGSLTACQEGGDAGDLFGQWRLDGSDSKYISFSGASGRQPLYAMLLQKGRKERFYCRRAIVRLYARQQHPT